jgi:hypothetical protein
MQTLDLTEVKRKNLETALSNLEAFQNDVEELEDALSSWEEHEINNNMHSFERPEILDYYSIDSTYKLYDFIELREKDIKKEKQKIEDILLNG